MNAEHQNREIAYCRHCNAALIYRPDDYNYEWVDGGYNCGTGGHVPRYIDPFHKKRMEEG